MSYFVVGIKNNVYRVYNSDINKFIDCNIEQLARIKLENAKVDNNTLIGTTGSLEKITNKVGYVVVGTYKKNDIRYYIVASSLGKVTELRKEQLIRVFKDLKLQNASIIEDNYIRGINWTIPDIEIPVNKVELMLCRSIFRVLMRCKANAHKELPLEITLGKIQNTIEIKCRAVELYAKSNKAKEIYSLITCNQNNIKLELYDITNTGKIKNGTIDIPFNNYTEVVEKLAQEAPIWFGLCGYVRGDVSTAFMDFRVTSKSDFDAIDAYTNGSGHINRTCRGIPYDNEKTGDCRSAILREIKYIDEYLESGQIVRPLMLFRGCPYDNYISKMLGKPADKLEGCLIKDDAYLSTTINFQVTPNFATGKFKDRKDVPGIIQIYRNNIGVFGKFIHNVAKWSEQFEIMIDRRYDTLIKKKLFSLKLHGKTFYVYECEFVLHTGTKYNELGKLPFDSEYTEGLLHKCYDQLKREGYNYLTYQHSKDNNMIIIPTEIGDDKICNDIGITYGTNNLGIKSLDFYRLVGQREDVYTYRVDSTKGNKDKTTILGYNIDKLTNIVFYKSIHLEIDSVSSIINQIKRFITYEKEVILFSLIDLGRFFNEVFLNILSQEGYDIYESIRVEHKGDTTKPQSGYVPLRIRINGDDDDSLIISMRLYRDSDKNLVIDYSGQSLNKKVSGKNKIVFNSFNNEIAEINARNILYEFASKLKLSCTRKLDNAMLFVSNQLKYKVIRSNIEASPRNSSYAFVCNNEIKYNAVCEKPLNQTYRCYIKSIESRSETKQFEPQHSIKYMEKTIKDLIASLDDKNINVKQIYYSLMHQIIQEIKEYKIDMLNKHLSYELSTVNNIKLKYQDSTIYLKLKLDSLENNRFRLAVNFNINNTTQCNYYSFIGKDYSQIVDKIKNKIISKLDIDKYKEFENKLLKLDKIIEIYYGKLRNNVHTENIRKLISGISIEINNKELEIQINKDINSVNIVNSTDGNQFSIIYTEKDIEEVNKLLKKIVLAIEKLVKIKEISY